MKRKVLLAHSSRLGCPEQTYKAHISEVVRRAMEFASKAAPYTPFGDLFVSTVRAAAEYHDLGKVDVANQKVLRGETSDSLPVDHRDAGTAYLLNKGCPAAGLCVFSHHAKKPYRGLPSIPKENSDIYPFRVRTSPRNSIKTVREITDEMMESYIKEHESEMGAGPRLPKGLAPGSTFLRFALSCLVDADHTDTAQNYGNVVPEGKVPLAAEQRLAALDRYVTSLATNNADNRERNEMRQLVYDACRTAQPAENGVIACDSPVGTGKTTAVMAHLLNVARKKGLRRVFVVLPFTNIIDQSVEVYRKSLVLDGEAADKVVAAHHHKAEFEEEATRAFSFLWNAPVTVTTAVQFFETLASNHPATLRKLHQLAGSAIFIDEAHAALPAHLWPQAWKWLQELVKDWGCYIVMASGSLTRFWELEEFASPQLQLLELVSPSVRASTVDAEQKRIVYRMKDEALTLEELCDWIAELPSPRIVILNTVQSAAVVAKEMAKRHDIGKVEYAQKGMRHNCYRNGDKDKVEHLSTALAPVHRKATIDRIKKRLKDKQNTDWTLVATSCVEAGIDFSFKSAAREQCSLVSTIQTSGRANRSGEFGTSDLWIFKIKAGDMLKEHPAFRTSARILAELYREQKISPDFCKEAMRREVRDLNQGLCDDDAIVKDEKKRKFPDVEEKFKIIASNTISVLVDEELRQRFENRERRKEIEPQELQQKTVAIYNWKASQYGVMPLQGAGDLYFWMLEYDDFLGYMAGVLNLANFDDHCCI